MLSFLCYFPSAHISCTRSIQILRTDRGLSFWGDRAAWATARMEPASCQPNRLCSERHLATELWSSFRTPRISNETLLMNCTKKKSWIRSYKPLNHSKLKCHETQSISGKAFPYRLLEKTKPSACSKINPDEIKWSRIVLHEITRISLRCCRAVFCKRLS